METPTPYSIIFDRFIKKLKNDKDFLNYTGLTDTEIELLVKDHSIDLLNQAIGMIYEYGNPDVDLYDKDDTLETFNIELVKQEIELLINIMYQKYFEEDRNKMRYFELQFTSSELNVFSPAANRTSFENMLNKIEDNNKRGIDNYLSRNRNNWSLKSIYKS